MSFEKLKIAPKIELDLYNSINRIPFSLKVGNCPILSKPIYARNLGGGNFIEFRFDRTNKNLYEMSLVSVDADTVEDIETNEINCQKNEFHNCFIHEADSKLEDSVPMKIFRDKKSICINWGIEDQTNLEYFLLSSNCFLGINADSYLASVILTNLLQEDIFNIFGF